MSTIVFGVLGILGGILCARADVPLAISGKPGDRTIYQVGKIAPWWAEVPQGRFLKSFWLSFIGQPFTYLAMWMLAGAIADGGAAGLALALKICTGLSAYTGLFYHAACCLQPLVYREIAGSLDDKTAERAVAAILKLAAVPAGVCSLCLVFGSTGIVAAAILTGALAVPVWFVLFNPVVGILLAVGLRKFANLALGGGMGIGFVLYGILLIAVGRI